MESREKKKKKKHCVYKPETSLAPSQCSAMATKKKGNPGEAEKSEDCHLGEEQANSEWAEGCTVTRCTRTKSRRAERKHSYLQAMGEAAISASSTGGWFHTLRNMTHPCKTGQGHEKFTTECLFTCKVEARMAVTTSDRRSKCFRYKAQPREGKNLVHVQPGSPLCYKGKLGDGA